MQISFTIVAPSTSTAKVLWTLAGSLSIGSGIEVELKLGVVPVTANALPDVAIDAL